MIETQMSKKDLKEAFRSFLINLDVFLDSRAILENTRVEVLFIQEPETVFNELYACGLVQIGQYAFPMEISMDMDLGVVRVDSKVFHYRLKVEDMIEFVKEHGGA